MSEEKPDIVELKRCPFCGGEAEIWRAHGERTAWIGCMGRCSVLVSKEHKTDAEAIAAWNTRADNAELLRLRGEVERLTGREADLLSANNRYLMRARDAEAVLADLLKFASGVETTAAYPTFQRARAILSSAPKPGEG